jgi:hypothetical protein
MISLTEGTNYTIHIAQTSPIVCKYEGVKFDFQKKVVFIFSAIADTDWHEKGETVRIYLEQLGDVIKNIEPA